MDISSSISDWHKNVSIIDNKNLYSFLNNQLIFSKNNFIEVSMVCSMANNEYF